jgi:hypothetical protein
MYADECRDTLGVSSKVYEEWIFKNKNKFADTDKNHNAHSYIANVQMPITSYIESYFSIVTESIWNSPQIKNDITYYNCCLTEKSYKPIAMLQPFIIIGQHYVIDFLRNTGYDVFDDIIDHSYDDEIDQFVRLSKFKQEMFRLCSISNEDWSNILYKLLPRLIHNYEHLCAVLPKFIKFHTPLYKGEKLNYTEFYHV